MYDSKPNTASAPATHASRIFELEGRSTKHGEVLTLHEDMLNQLFCQLGIEYQASPTMPGGAY